MDQDRYPFISDVFPSEQKLSSIDDLLKFYGSLKVYMPIVDQSFYETSRDDDTYELLDNYSINNLDIRHFIGKSLTRIDNVKNDGKLICIKTMLVIYHYLVMMYKYIPLAGEPPIIQPFICYIEEKILPKVFDCAKKLKKEVLLGGTIRQFETGLESLESWQLIILHMYVRLQVEVITSKKVLEVGSGCFANSFFVMLTVLKYFCEKKQKYLKEHYGLPFQVEHFTLIRDHLLFWPNLRKFLKSNDLEVEDEIYQNFARALFRGCSEMFIECIYSFSDMNPSNNQEIITSDTRSILTKAVHSSDDMWNHFLSLLKEDYNDVKDMDDFSIISNEKSKNFGTVAHVVKFKILNTLGYALEHNDSHYDVTFATKKRYEVLLFFKDFIIENMKRKDSTNPDQTSVRDVAIVVSVAAVSLKIDLLLEPASNDYLELVSTTFERWKELFFSQDMGDRIMINSSYTLFLDKTRKCNDDLMKIIIDGYQANLPNFVLYAELLKISRKYYHGNSDSVLESFKQVISNAFETFIKNDTIEYLENVPNLDEEGKLILHKDHVLSCLSMMDEIYFAISDNIQFEHILSIIKHKCEIIFKKDNFEENENLIFCFVSLLANIIRKTEQNALLRVLNKLDYYPLITRIIRTIMLEKIIDYSKNIVSDLGPLPLFIGYLCNTGIILNCPYDFENQEENKHFLYDFLLPKIIKIVVIPKYFFTGFRLLLEESDNGFMSIVRSCWALGRIVHNDIMQNGGERSLAKLDECMEDILENIGMRDTDVQMEYSERLLSVLVFITQKRMVDLAPHLIHYRASLYLLGTQESIDKEETYQLFSLVYQVVEYLFDNGFITLTAIELDWIEDLIELKDTLPLFLRIQCCRIIQKLKSMGSNIQDDDDDDDEENWVDIDDEEDEENWVDVDDDDDEENWVDVDEEDEEEEDEN